MYITEGQKVSNILTYGARRAMSLEEIIVAEIKEWDNSPVKNNMILGWKYYRNEQDGELVSGFIRKLTKQKNDYLLGRPFSVNSDNKDYASLLYEIFNALFRQGLKQTGIQAITKGIGWMQVYFDENQIAFQVIPSEEVIPLWVDAAHTKLDAVIRTYYREEYEGLVKKKVRHVEFWDKTGVKRYIYNSGQLTKDVEAGDSSHITIGNKEHNWERVPFVAFKYNDDELPLIKGLKGAIDDYDKQKNVIAELLQNIPNFIYVLKNYGGTSLAEFLTELKEYKAIKVDEDGGVDKLQAAINIDAYDTYIQQARKDIYEFGRGVDTQAVDLGNASGQALKFRYADLDMDCNDMETEFAAGMQSLLWFVNRYLALTGQGDYLSEQAEIVFNRDVIINESEAIQECANSKDIISDATIIANHPWVEDAAEEEEKLKKQRTEQAKEQQTRFGMTINTPPGDDDE